MKNKDLPIGTRTRYDDVELVVVAQEGNKALCTGCYFSNYVRTRNRKAEFSYYVHGMACTKHLRKDRKHVIFKQICDNYNYYCFDTTESIDYLNSNHFDYRGLIPMDLAIEVTKENNPYKTKVKEK